MKEHLKRAITALLCAATIVVVTGCYAHRIVVGSGASTGQQETAKQWYLLWGLVPLSSVNTKAMAGGASNYTIDSREEVLDILIYGITAGIVGAQTVVVTK
jgi:hypothetical protein